MASVCKIFRYELPTTPGVFTIQAHGFKPLSLVVENGVPVLYEIGCVDEVDNKPWPHQFVWMLTGEPLPKEVNQSWFCGTIVLENGFVAHLFRVWGV